MKFTKMHGCGNDYVYVNLFEEKLDDPARVSIYVSDRHFGIGSDGLITIGPSGKADFRMRIYNADGSEAEMCGNGIRCVAKYVYDHKLTDKTEISVETGAGIKYLTLYVEENVLIYSIPPCRVIRLSCIRNSKNRSFWYSSFAYSLVSLSVESSPLIVSARRLPLVAASLSTCDWLA